MKKSELRQIIKEELLREDATTTAKKFIDILNKKYNNPEKDKFGSYTFDGKFGSKFVKITSKPTASSGLSAWGFVALQDNPSKGIKVGDLLKPASWSAPAKHARGNIIDGTAKYDKYGPAYMR